MLKYTSFDHWYNLQSGLSGPEVELRSSFEAAREEGSLTMTREELQKLISTGDHNEVRVPAGIHTMEPRENGDANIYISGKQRLKLTGPGALSFPDDKGGIVFNTIDGAPSEDCIVEGLGVFGGANRITIKACDRITIRDCVLTGVSEVGAGVSVEQQSHNINMYNLSIADCAVGINIASPDVLVSGGQIRACTKGIYCNAPAVRITDMHVFPHHSETKVGFEFGPWTGHLTRVDNCYLDNIQEYFVLGQETYKNGRGPHIDDTFFLSKRHAATAVISKGDFTRIENPMVEIITP